MPDRALDANSIQSCVESPSRSEEIAYPTTPIIRIGLRPVRSEMLPQMGAQMNSSSAEVATSSPNSLPLAPNSSMKNGKIGMTIPYPSMSTTRVKNRIEMCL